MEPRWTIYCHIHTESGRRYVGLTKRSWQERWRSHVHGAKRVRTHFANAIWRYGKEAFSHEVLEICDSLEEANAAEERWIAHYGTRDPAKGFNIKKGGAHTPHPVKNPWDRPEFRAANAGRNVKHLLTPEARAKQRASMRSPESKAKRSAAAKAALASPETKAKRKALYENSSFKEKISKSLKASLSSEDARSRMSEASRASATQEVKERRSVAIRKAYGDPAVKERHRAATAAAQSDPALLEKRRSYRASEETRAKIGKSSKGRKHSPEAKARMRELARARWADPAVRAAHAAGLRRP